VKAVKAKAVKFANNIDTDVILPGKWLSLIDPKELAKHAMEGLDPAFPQKARHNNSGRQKLWVRLKPRTGSAGAKIRWRAMCVGRIFRAHILPQQHKHRLARH
jgi:hypothetical protein